MYILEEQKENALKYARENQVNYGLSCSESVLNALIRAGIIDLPEYYTCLATGLSGGVGASGNTYGAVYGRKNPLSEPADSEKAGTEEDFRFDKMRVFNNFVNDYVRDFGHCRCRRFVDDCGGYFEKKRVDWCPELIVHTTELAIKYLSIDEEKLKAFPYRHNVYGWE